MNDHSKILMQSRTGGLSLFAVVLALGGAACAGLQIMMLIGGELSEVAPGARFLPGILSVVFLGLFAWLGLRQGEVRVYRDRVEGRTKAGKKYDLLWAEIAGVDLRSRALVLKGMDGKNAVVDRPPRNRRIRGLIHLRLEHDFPAAVWEAISPAAAEALPGAGRLFEDDSGTTQFIDGGFLVEVGGRMVYLPEHDTVPTHGAEDRQNRLSTQVTAAGMLLRFDPNPADLPLREVAAALLAAGLEGKLQLARMEELVDAHGGTFLEKSADDWVGETAGWRVKVIPTEP